MKACWFRGQDRRYHGSTCALLSSGRGRVSIPKAACHYHQCNFLAWSHYAKKRLMNPFPWNV